MKETNGKKRFVGQLGYTLIQILLAMMIVSIVAAIVVPYAWRFSQKSALMAQVDQLRQVIRYARSVAIERQQIVTLCPTDNQSSCGGQWVQGQLVKDHHGHVLRVFPASAGECKVYWSNGLSQDDRIRFLPSGFTDGQQGHFSFQDDQGRYDLIIMQTGRVRLQKVLLNK